MSALGATAGAYPRVFGPYVLVGELGRGGMGEVYLAWSGSVAGIAKLCVVKTMRPDVSEPEIAHRRFLDEARISVSLSHANICTVYDVGQVADASYIAMEYAGRRTLRDVQNRARELGVGLPEDAAIWVVSRVLEGLDHAHGARDPMTGKPLHVVHRDVSPQNVMVRHDGAVKLIDFGLARSDAKVEQTQSGMVAGKLTYMAPEQVRSESVDARADQFAAAVMLYELISGERFYEGLREHEIWGAAATGGFRPRRWDVISPDLEVILSVALAPEPAARFATCEAFLEALTTSVKAVPPAQRAGGGRRFKQVMSELFPNGEEEERVFLQGLPDYSSVRQMSPIAMTPPATSAPSPSPSPSLPGDDTAALVARMQPKRWPLPVAAGVVVLAILAYVGVRALNTSDTESATDAATIQTANSVATDRDPAQTVGVEPKQVEPKQVEPKQVEPEQLEPKHVAPKQLEPKHIEPKHIEPKHIEPKDIEPKRVEPKRVDPQRKVAKAPEPNPEGTAAEATSGTEIDVIRTRLSRCTDACAPVWRKQLAGRSEVPENARTSLHICLARCDKEPK